jgi:hypothetical protein
VILARFYAFRIASFCFALLAPMMPATSKAGEVSPVSTTSHTATNIVVGFVGGFVGHDNFRHGPVQLAQHIQGLVPAGTYVRIFENRRRKQACQAILSLLDANHDGILSAEEKTRARIILFGHSWGAAAAVLLARDLRHKGVPVMLTVQVDSIAKMWQNDSVIPDNVAAAVNFYQPHGILHGEAQITAADPARTQILGNYRMDYRKHPIRCPDASWADRVFTPGHVQSECDPQLWSQIEGMIERLLPAGAQSAASISVLP